MKKHRQWVIAFGFASLFVAGCLASASSDEEPSEAQVEQGLGSAFRFEEYYSDSSLTTRVGYCVGPSVCSGGSTVCYGTKTRFVTREIISCD